MSKLKAVGRIDERGNYSGDTTDAPFLVYRSEPDAPDAPSADPVGEVGTMPVSSGFTLATFRASEVPVGTNLYAIPPDAAAEIARLRGLLDEQKGTIRALNMALAGEAFPTTEHLVAAHEIDPGCAGLISLCMELRAEVERLTKECDNIKQVEFPRRLDKVVEGWRKKCDGQAERIAELEREVEEYDDALLASDADLMKAQDQAKALATAVMTDQVSNDSHALFIAAIRDLAAISEALGCDPDDGGAVPIIEAIDELKETIDAQTVALAKVKDVLTMIVMTGDKPVARSREALAVIATLAHLDGTPAGDPAECWCEKCRPKTIGDMRMILCPTCGNKRCPHATDHRNACTGSNEPGQPGSAYAAQVGEEGKPQNDAERM